MTSHEVADILAHGFSHVGKVRPDNQDSFRLRSPGEELTGMRGCMYGVADGMGGYEHGGIASTLALEAFFETYYHADGSSVSQRLREGVQVANLGVYQTARRLGVARMGTTLTVVNVIGHTMHIAHVGDSRAYLIRDQKAICLTNDHTRVGELVRMKLLSPDKVRTHNQRSVLNRCLGVDLFVQPDIFQVPVQDGDCIILCTDGVWSVIEDEEFAKFAAEELDPEKLNQKVFELAMKRDSDDNLSVMSLRLQRLLPSPPGAGDSRWNRLLQRFKRRGDLNV